MSTPADIVIIGAGHNGLVAAYYLARAGRKPLVLEARSVAGGCVASEEFAPGFVAPLANALGPLRPSVVRDLHLTSRVSGRLGPGPVVDLPQLEKLRALVVQALASWLGSPPSVLRLDAKYQPS